MELFVARMGPRGCFVCVVYEVYLSRWCVYSSVKVRGKLVFDARMDPGGRFFCVVNEVCPSRCWVFSIVEVRREVRGSRSGHCRVV